MDATADYFEPLSPESIKAYEDTCFKNLDYDEDQRATVKEIANDLLISLLGEGMTEEELQQALEAINDELGREMAIFDSSDDEILETLAELGLETDRAEFCQLVETCLGEDQLFDALCKKAGVQFEEGDPDMDLAFAAIGELWARWRPDAPSFMTMLDAIAEGYAYRPGERADALAAWQEAWEALGRVVRLQGNGILDDAEEVVYGRSISDWLEDYQFMLTQAADQDDDYKGDLFLFEIDLKEMRG